MVIHDYFSFTFCPEELMQYRKLAAAGRQSMAQFIKSREGTEQALNVDIFDDRCRENLTTFLQYVTKDFFKGQEYTTHQAWFDLFTPRERPSGMFGYKSSWDLYMNGSHIGIAAAGAKNGGCYISFSGEGMAMIDPKKLFEQIQYLPMVKITRVDLAIDDYEGKYNYDYAFNQWRRGAFKMRTGGVNPKIWLHKSGGELTMNEYGIMCDVEYTEGRTFQVGHRKSGKLCRIYEKGKQQGDPSSRWTRWEVELHSKDREIPLFVLLDPASYFLGSYPALRVFEPAIEAAKQASEDKAKLIQTGRKKRVKIGYERMVGSARSSYGPLINVMRQSRNMSYKQIVEELISVDPFAVPRRLEKAVGVSLPDYIAGPSIPTDIAQERAIIPIIDSGPWKAPEVNNQGASSCLN